VKRTQTRALSSRQALAIPQTHQVQAAATGQAAAVSRHVGRRTVLTIDMGPGVRDCRIDLRFRSCDAVSDTGTVVGPEPVGGGARLASGLADAVLEEYDAGIERERLGVGRYSAVTVTLSTRAPPMSCPTVFTTGPESEI
jgi:hypothetical protein